MHLIILIVIAVLIIRFLTKRKAKEEPVEQPPVDPATLPDTLAELRRMRDKNSGKNQAVAYHCQRKILETGMQLYQEGKLVAKYGDDHDVNKLLEEMNDMFFATVYYQNFQRDDAFQFRCLECCMEMVEDFRARAKNDPDVEWRLPTELVQSSWPVLADFYTEGRVCPRDPDLARKYWRTQITFVQKKENEIPDTAVMKLMEVPVAGDFGPEEISKWTAAMYGLGALKIRKGEIVRNFTAQPVRQCAELLFQMDWDRIGSADTAVMLDEYRKGAESGNAYAQFKLGSFYLKGRYVEKDVEKGVALLKQAIEQDLYFAAKELSNHYYWIAYPFAGDHGNKTKQQIKEDERIYSFWGDRRDKLLKQVEVQYANSFSTLIPSTKNQPTRGVPKPAPVPSHTEDEPAYVGRSGLTDSESPFTVLDLPDVIKDGFGNIYRKTSVSTDSADYWGDNGNSTTIHVSDIGMSGNNAKNSDGYFHW